MSKNLQSDIEIQRKCQETIPIDNSNKRCNNCRAYGHLKKACPELQTFNIGVITVCKEEKNEIFHSKAQESFKKEVSNTLPIARIGYLTSVPIDNKSSVKTEATVSNAGGKKNFNSRNPINAHKYYSGQQDSDSDDNSSNSSYCSICESNEHDEMDCCQEEMMAFNYKCYYCDKTGHFEDKCPSFLKVAKKEEADDKKWRQKWGKKIQKNKKLLQSMSKKPSMHCQHCYSIHHNTEVCFLSPYGIKEDLKI